MIEGSASPVTLWIDVSWWWLESEGKMTTLLLVSKSLYVCPHITLATRITEGRRIEVMKFLWTEWKGNDLSRSGDDHNERACGEIRVVRRRGAVSEWEGMSRETPACHGEDIGRGRHGHLEAPQRQACQGGRREDDGRDCRRSRQRSWLRVWREGGEDRRTEVKPGGWRTFAGLFIRRRNSDKQKFEDIVQMQEEGRFAVVGGKAESVGRRILWRQEVVPVQRRRDHRSAECRQPHHQHTPKFTLV